LSKNGETLNPKLGHRSQKFGFVFVLNKISSSALFFCINPRDSFIHSQDVRAQMAKKKRSPRKAHQMDYFITKLSLNKHAHAAAHVVIKSSMLLDLSFFFFIIIIIYFFLELLPPLAAAAAAVEHCWNLYK
jgi:hypothetical protein